MKMPSEIKDAQDTAGKYGMDVSVPRGDGITAWANAQWAGSARGRAVAREREDSEGVYVYSEEEARAKERGGEVIIAPDGYVRRSPVQEIVVPPDYYRRRTRKIILAVCGAVLAVLAIYLLFRLRVIRF